MAAKHARGLKPVTGVVRLDIMVTAATRPSVPTAVADIPPSVRNAEKQNHIVTCTLQNTVTALATLKQKKYNKPLALPLTDDLVM